MPKFVNLTPHGVNIYDEKGETLLMTVPPSGTVARCATKSEIVRKVARVPLLAISYGEVADLPKKKRGTIYIVSLLVRAACPDRKDLASPGELLRNAEGQPVGCKGLAINR